MTLLEAPPRAEAPAKAAPSWLTPAQRHVRGALRVLTMFVTNVCNARCETCFYWMHLNDADKKNLSVDQLRQLARTMPDFPHLLVSGGEPVMRRDLPDVVSVFAEECGIQTFDMPTNGLLTKRCVDVVEQVLDRHPHLMITVGHSLDGFQETHDRLRGVPGNYDKLFATLEALVDLRRRREELHRQGKGPQPRLRLVTLTCINNQNIEEVERLADHVSQNHDVDGMTFECLRGTPKDPTLLPPTPEQFDRVVRKSMEVNDRVLARRFPEEHTTRLSYIRSVYRMQRDHITSGKLPVTCQAGAALAVLEPDGRLKMCELLDDVADLRDHELDWSRAWFSEKAEQTRRFIRETRCSCTHCVNLGNSIDQSPRTDWQRRLDAWLLSR
jgi:MoaA/NifB/PqqE/SkfB family radical SAM enzyme